MLTKSFEGVIVDHILLHIALLLLIIHNNIHRFIQINIFTNDENYNDV